MTFYQLVQIIAVLLTGLVAGLFYGYACSVTSGLGKLSDREYLTAFQSINSAILNAWFFTSFIGSLVALPMATWLSYSAGANSSFWLLLLATAMYMVGVFSITMWKNVPLNNLVAHFNSGTASAQELSSLRARFEDSWNKWHLIRTAAAIVSFLLAILSLLKIK